MGYILQGDMRFIVNRNKQSSVKMTVNFSIYKKSPTKMAGDFKRFFFTTSRLW